VAFPSLLSPRRPYSLIEEEGLFDGARVRAYLAEWTRVRGSPHRR